MLKTCFKCKRELERTEFYKHPQMGDGLLGKCKDCTRDDVTEHRIKNVGRIRQYDRERSALPKRRALVAVVSAAWKAIHPERRRAQNALNNAVRDGRITKPDTCQRCGIRSGRIEGHHPDYSRPFDVEWLCKPCHYIADEERRAA